MPSPFLTAEWRKLAIANYVVDSSILKPYVPPKTKLELREGQCYVSVVAFMFIDTRVKGIKIPFHVNFEEINLRFYVRSEYKRGVVFIKEIVGKPAVSFIANSLFRENYETMPIAHSWIATPTTMNVEYRWKKHDWNVFRVSGEKALTTIIPGTEEDFITNNYWGYTCRNGICREYEVKHPHWEAYPVTSHHINIDFGRLYGEKFAHLTHQKPASVFLIEGSPISVLDSKKI